MSEPQVVEVSINRGGGGKVAILSYGNITSDYHASITRRYAIPEDWDDDAVRDFEDKVLGDLKPRVDEILDAEFEERWSQSYLNENA